MKSADQITNFLTSTTNPEHFQKIFSMVPHIEDAPFTMKEFKVWWVKNYNPQFFRVWIETDEDQKEVFSFMIAHIVKPLIENEVFILLTYIDPKSSMGHNLLGCVEGWARTMGIKKISAYIYRNVDGFCQKYKFQKGFTEIFKSLEY